MVVTHNGFATCRPTTFTDWEGSQRPPVAAEGVPTPSIERPLP